MTDTDYIDMIDSIGQQFTRTERYRAAVARIAELEAQVRSKQHGIEEAWALIFREESGIKETQAWKDLRSEWMRTHDPRCRRLARTAPKEADHG